MDSKSSQCASCLRDGDVVLSTHWCTDCSETLCTDCNKYHKKSKATTKHKVIPIETVSELSPAVLTLSYKCKTHPDQSVAFFCVTHDAMCCATCIPEYHQHCSDLITLDNGAENVKKSKFLEILEKRIKGTRTKLDEIIKKKEENISNIKEQKNRIQDDIGYIRKKINDHFDKIEKQLNNTLNRAHESCIKTLEDGIKQIKERVKKMDVWYKDIETLKENSSDVHVFAVVKTIHPLQNKQEAYLNNLQEELTRLSIGFVQEETWRHLISEVPSFGEICVTEANSKKTKQYIRFKRSEYGANLEERLRPVPTSRKFIFPTSKLNNGAKIRNACFLPDDRLVLISFNENCIYVCNKDGDKKKRIPLPFKPSDITLYDKHNIILANGTRIQSFKTDSFTFGQHVSVVALNDVISSANNQIAIRSPSGSISVMDIEGKLRRQIQTHSYGQISMDRFGRVYYSNNAKNEVHCFYPDGSHCCIYRHEDLKDPSGMTTDDLGNVYVAGHMSHNIHKISAQGKRQEIILSSKDGIHYPQRIAYNEKTHELLVINCEWRSVEIYQFK